MEVGKIIIDFEVAPTFNPTKLIVDDSSNWSNAENLPSTISITPPGSIRPINSVFAKYRRNIFNSVNLGLSCLTECDNQNYEDLLDGIWTINVKSGFEGLEKTRYYLKNDIFRLDLDGVYIRTGLEFDKSNKRFRDDLSDIEFLLRVAEAHTRNGDIVKADRDFTQAQYLLGKYKNCKDCI
jgi:hypothetical protein